MNYFKNMFVDTFKFLGYNDYDMILPNIYVGNYNSSSKENLDKLRINVVLNCSKVLPFNKKQNINIRLPVTDDLTLNSNLIMVRYIVRILPKIKNYHNKKYRILIHCRAGMQRSAAFMAAYLMKYYKLSLGEAIQYIKSKRNQSFFMGPNFYITLKLFEKHCI
jgi:protein-tyrosine phosphatase